MKNHRLALVLTVANLALLLFQLVRLELADAKPGLSVLRGTGLQLVDSEGRPRVSFELLPENTAYEWPDGHKGYPETVILRMSTADGKPRVKLTTSEDGSTLMLLGDSDTTHTILKADRDQTSLLLRNDEEVQQILHP